ncbi:MAG: hypothetical protein ABMA01_18640 [Chthoniobacteraceae bacterium]
MKALCEKVKILLPALLERGPVYLLALFERDDAAGKWDVVLSAAWSDADTASAIRFVSAQLVPSLSPEELGSLSRIAIIPSTTPSISAMTSVMNITGGHTELVDCNLMGLQIKHAYIFRAQRPPAQQPGMAQTV